MSGTTTMPAMGEAPAAGALTGEALNRWTHAAGFLVAVPAAWLMWQACAHQDAAVLIAFEIYGAAMVLLYAASSLSHSFESRPRLRRIFRTADQVCIYLMIAGTFTPFAVSFLRTPLGLAQLAGMWGLAVCGIILRIRDRGDCIGKSDVALCLATGWIPIFSVAEIYQVGGPAGFCLVLAGGLFYTGGVFFLVNDHRGRYWHGIWHLAALGGTACHYAFLLDYVVPAER